MLAKSQDEETRILLENIARAISQRGQTIHGRKKIVELQAKSGVSLHDDASSETYTPNSIDSLNHFLIEYSKLCPASRLTVKILAYQNSVTVPEKLEKKRKSLIDRLREPSSFFDNL